MKKTPVWTPRECATPEGRKPIHRKTTLVICPDCGGRGIQQWEELADYHKGIYTPKTKDCKRCQNHGLVVQTTFTYERKLNDKELAPARIHNGKFTPKQSA